MDEEEKLIGIRWDENGKPFNINTEKTGYDVKWCERDRQFYLHDSGDGGKGRKGYIERTGSLETLEDFMDTFKAIFGDCRYCEVCEDFLPERNPCKHIVWSDDVGLWINIETGNMA